MKLGDARVDKLIDIIEREKRRKIVDFDINNVINYIDAANNVKKIQSYNNNIIEARRGCGKTSLIMKSLEGIEDTYVLVDCQMLRKDNQNNIVLKIANSILNKIQEEIENECSKKSEEYTRKYKGITGFFKKYRNEEAKKEKEEIECIISYLDYIKILKEKCKEIQNCSNEITVQSVNSSAASEKEYEKKEVKKSRKQELSENTMIALKYKKAALNLSEKLKYSKSFNSEEKTENNRSLDFVEKFSQEKIITKTEMINDLQLDFITMFEGYKYIKDKGIMLFLDDFYQIKRDSHPFILQYFHAISKNTKTGIFCYKVVTLPSSLKINYDNEVIFSVKDDYSKVELDGDLSNLEAIERSMVDMLIAMCGDETMSQNDIQGLFTADSLKYLVIATGGIPRDFMEAFSKAIQFSRSKHKATVWKDEIYDVVRKLKEDKDSNIEIDSELSSQQVEKLLEIITNQIIKGLKTNVILYPIELVEQHEKILKNLVNLRYLHIIKEKITSEKTKENCRAYLVDMTFYACGRMHANFNFCRFWEKDDHSILNNLRRSPVWSFSDEDVKIIAK